jgi:outer membrane receptor for ferrienterochelin and colicins
MPLDLTFLLLALSGPPAATCAIEGTVTDASGTPVAGAIVIVQTSDAGTRHGGVTDETGRYCIADATAGAIEVTVAAPGFAATTVRTTLPGDSPVRDISLLASQNENVVVTATRTRRLVDDLPVRTEVVGSAHILQSGARTLADAVEYTTGVRVENNCQNCNFSQIRLLGLGGPYTQILVDGQPVISALAQVYGIEQIPARMIDRIEVVKGGGSALYGAGSVGGVINIISREPSKRGGLLETRVDDGRALGGAWDWVAPDGRTSVTMFGQFDHVEARDINHDGFSDVSRRTLGAGGFRLTRVSTDHTRRLTIDASRIDEDRRGGDALDRPPHDALIAEWIRSRRGSASVSWSHTPGNSWDYRVTAVAAQSNRDSYYGTGRDRLAYGETKNTLGLVDAQVNRYTRQHTLSWGGQFSTDHTVDSQPAYGRRLNQNFSSTGLFVQNDWTIRPGVQLLSGTRVDWHDALAGPIVSPRAALLISPADPLDIRVSLARGFRAPQAFDEDLHLSSVGGDVRIVHLDAGLREERATTTTVGTEWKPSAGIGQALFEVNAFHTRLTDLFHIVDRDDPATPAFETLKTNLGGARVYGIEANAGWGFGDDFILQGGFVIQRARFDDAEPDFGSRDFFRTPERYGNVSLRWNTHSGWQLFAGGRWTGSMVAPHYAGFIESSRMETTPAFMVVDLSVGRQVTIGGRALVLTFSGRNLTNTYQRDLDEGPLRDATYVYGPRFPRSAGVSARMEF